MVYIRSAVSQWRRVGGQRVQFGKAVIVCNRGSPIETLVKSECFKLVLFLKGQHRLWNPWTILEGFESNASSSLLLSPRSSRCVRWKKSWCFGSVRVWFLIAVLYGKEAGYEKIKTLLRLHEMVTKEGSIKPSKVLPFYRGCAVGFTRGDQRRWYSRLPTSLCPDQFHFQEPLPAGFPLRVLLLWNALVIHTHSWCTLLSISSAIDPHSKTWSLKCHPVIKLRKWRNRMNLLARETYTVMDPTKCKGKNYHPVF